MSTDLQNYLQQIGLSTDLLLNLDSTANKQNDIIDGGYKGKEKEATQCSRDEYAINSHSIQGSPAASEFSQRDYTRMGNLEKHFSHNLDKTLDNVDNGISKERTVRNGLILSSGNLSGSTNLHTSQEHTIVHSKVSLLGEKAKSTTDDTVSMISDYHHNNNNENGEFPNDTNKPELTRGFTNIDAVISSTEERPRNNTFLDLITSESNGLKNSDLSQKQNYSFNGEANTRYVQEQDQGLDTEDTRIEIESPTLLLPRWTKLSDYFSKLYIDDCGTATKSKNESSSPPSKLKKPSNNNYPSNKHVKAVSFSNELCEIPIESKDEVIECKDEVSYDYSETPFSIIYEEFLQNHTMSIDDLLAQIRKSSVMDAYHYNHVQNDDSVIGSYLQSESNKSDSVLGETRSTDLPNSFRHNTVLVTAETFRRGVIGQIHKDTSSPGSSKLPTLAMIQMGPSLRSKVKVDWGTYKDVNGSLRSLSTKVVEPWSLEKSHQFPSRSITSTTNPNVNTKNEKNVKEKSGKEKVKRASCFISFVSIAFLLVVIAIALALHFGLLD